MKSDNRKLLCNICPEISFLRIQFKFGVNVNIHHFYLQFHQRASIVQNEKVDSSLPETDYKAFISSSAIFYKLYVECEIWGNFVKNLYFVNHPLFNGGI